MWWAYSATLRSCTKCDNEAEVFSSISGPTTLQHVVFRSDLAVEHFHLSLVKSTSVSHWVLECQCISKLRFLCVLDRTCNTYTTAGQVSLILNSRKRWRPDKPGELGERRHVLCSRLDFCLESLHQNIQISLNYIRIYILSNRISRRPYNTKNQQTIQKFKKIKISKIKKNQKSKKFKNSKK